MHRPPTEEDALKALRAAREILARGIEGNEPARLAHPFRHFAAYLRRVQIEDEYVAAMLEALR